MVYEFWYHNPFECNKLITFDVKDPLTNTVLGKMMKYIQYTDNYGNCVKDNWSFCKNTEWLAYMNCGTFTKSIDIMTKQELLEILMIEEL